MSTDNKAAEPKGIVSIAVEDDGILMMHSIVKWDGKMWQFEKDTDIEALTRSLDEPDGSDTDYRERKPSLIIEKICHYLEECYQDPVRQKIDCVGVSIFGNVDVHSGSVRYKFDRKGDNNDEYIVQLREEIQRRIPSANITNVVVRNDATAAAHGESIYTSDELLREAFVYVWLGRGTNAGIVLSKEPHLGFMHPEVGHTFPRLHPLDESKGFVQYLRATDNPRCVSHRDCLLGLIAWRSIRERLFPPFNMSQSDVTNIVGYYVAQLCINLMVTICPARIVLGGSVVRSQLLKPNDLLEEVVAEVNKLLKGFPSYTKASDLKKLIGLAQLGDQSSLEGIRWSALQALDDKKQSEERVLAGPIGLSLQGRQKKVTT